MNTPQFRFKSFSEPWEHNTLGQIATFSKGKGISKADIVENGTTPCIRYGELYTHYGEIINDVISRTNVAASSLVLSQENDVIIPASGESAIDIATASCVTISGVALGGDLNIIRSSADGKFLAYYLNSRCKAKIASLSQGISVIHLYSTQLKTLDLNTPSLPEQQKIASFLSSVDERIELLERKKEKLETYKKGVMQQIFTQQIRFKKDDGSEFPDWEEKRLGEVTFKTGKKNRDGKILPTYSINNLVGFLPQSEQFDGIDSFERGFDTKSYKIVEKNMFAYNPARINVGSYGFSGDLENVLISSLYVCFKTTAEVDPLFLFQFMKTELFKKAVLKNTEGGVRDYLFYENFSKIKIPLPSTEEQEKITAFLSTIDENLETLDSQIQGLRTWKKGLLQQMFV